MTTMYTADLVVVLDGWAPQPGAWAGEQKLVSVSPLYSFAGAQAAAS